MRKLLDILVGRLLSRLDRHLSDQWMARLFCGEATFAQRWIARRHLANCSYCRVRREHLEGPRAERMLEIYRDAIDDEEGDLRQESRGEFAVWLDVQMGRASPRPRRFFLSWLPSLSSLSASIPALSCGLALGLVAGSSSLYAWWLERVPHITSNALLVRAEKWDGTNTSSAPGVVYQVIQINSASEMMQRSLYRDVQGRRRIRAALSPVMGEQSRAQQMKAELGQAGVDWDQPLSAGGYQAWHDRQHERADRITFAGRHLLTLTTSLPNGAVLKESLTVRDTDFHPVRRAIDFRDRGTVEIAELEYKVLPWSAVDASAFEPVGEINAPVATASPVNLPMPALDRTPSADQLDETELAARLILNQLHADTGEQIEIHRTARGIEVDGVVETEERKNELRAQLLTVPRLRVSIQSATDAKSLPAAESEAVSVESAAMPDSPSPLEAYLRARGRTVSEINSESQALFNGALAISQESRALAELSTRFTARDARPFIVSATVMDLLYSHRERLEAALLRQRVLLAKIGDVSSSLGATTAQGGPPLTEQAARHLALVRDLTQTNSDQARSAEAIFAEMSATLDALDAASRELYAKSQQNSAMSGKD